MAGDAELQVVLDRFVNGTYTAADVEALRRLHLTGRIVLSVGDGSVTAAGDITDSVVIVGNENVVVKGEGALVLQQVLREIAASRTRTALARREQAGLLFVAVLAAGLVLLLASILFRSGSPQDPSTAKVPSLETGLCNGQPVSVTIPAGPAEFDRRFGYTYYNATNSRELALNAIRSLLADESGLWIGYGATSDVGRTGISHVSFDRGGYRLWEYCQSALGRPIGHRANAMAKAKDGTLWVASDGAGVWHLRRGVWEQFVYDPKANNDAPDPSTFAVEPLDDNILVGMDMGVTRWKGAGWERVLYNKAVHALAVDAKGNVWVGYITDGLSRNPWDSSRTDYNIANGSLTGNQTREIAIDKQGRVWVATFDGGLDMFDNGQWTAFRGRRDGFPSDNVFAVAVDKYDRVWAGTDKGTVFRDGQTWRMYTDLGTRAITFGPVERKACPPEETAWDVWLGTDDRGLVNSRLPAATAVIADVRVSNVPETVRPGQTFAPAVTVTLEQGYELTQGDFLQSLQDESYTSNPLVGLPPGVTAQGGQSYTFRFDRNVMHGPARPGHYVSTWRLWQCGRYAGPTIPIEFDVSDSP